MDIQELVRQAWAIADAKGFHGDPHTLHTRDSTLIRLALIHTEVSEATQVVKRHGVDDRRDMLAEELADVLIRVADLAGCLALDLDAAVQVKLAKNAQRPRQYGTPWEER
jgi:NTP pyrophosphatase (non-canonical NTP hydrolase)